MKSANVLVLCLVFALTSCTSDLLFNPDGSSSESQIRLRSLWVIGGLSGNGITTTVPEIDAYDPVDGTWYPAITSIPTPVSFFGAVGYKGRIYIIGGFDSAGVARADVQIYTIATNTWSTGGSMSAARANIDASLADGYIYVLSGSNTNYNAGYSSNNTTFRYNTTSDFWDTRTAPGPTRINMSQYTYGGTVYCLGMRTAAATLSTTFQGYIPVVTGTDAVTAALPVMTLAKTGFVADVYEKPSGAAYLIIAGGVSAMTGTNANYVFNGTTAYTAQQAVQFIPAPFTGTVVNGSGWNTAGQSLPDVTGFASGAIANDTYYVMGGTKTGIPASAPPSGMSTLFYSDLSSFPSNTWQTGPAMPRGRYGHRVVRILSN